MGEEYAHAEARKSPVLDGKVERDSGGKELRYPVILSAHEKLIAKRVCKVFKVHDVILNCWKNTQFWGWGQGWHPSGIPVALEPGQPNGGTQRSNII